MGKQITDKAKKLDKKLQKLEKNFLKDRANHTGELKKEIEEKKKRYFNASGNTSDLDLKKVIEALGVEIYGTYLPYIREIYEPLWIYDSEDEFDLNKKIRYFEIIRWVHDKDENSLEKLINVYQVLASEMCSIALIFERTVKGCKVTMAIADDSQKNSLEKAREYAKKVANAIRGNFPGSELKLEDEEKNYGYGVPECLQKAIEPKEVGDDKVREAVSSVAVVTNLASDKSENFISQSMEKLLDGVVPTNEDEAYVFVLLARPCKDILSKKNMVFEKYNILAPYSTWQESFSKNESSNITVSSSMCKSLGLNAGISAGVGVEVSAGVDLCASLTKSVSKSEIVGYSNAQTRTCTNYSVKHTLDLLEKQLQRFEQCSALGMWEFAAYAISKDAEMAHNVANMYLALTQGEDSNLSQHAISLWNGSIDIDGQKESAYTILICNDLLSRENLQEVTTNLFNYF